jgi:hypothetical protein
MASTTTCGSHLVRSSGSEFLGRRNPVSSLLNPQLPGLGPIIRKRATFAINMFLKSGPIGAQGRKADVPVCQLEVLKDLDS